jgi:putative NADPH-quinone reductase
MRITIIDGHPDPDPERFCHVLACAYAKSAGEGKHEVTHLRLAELDVPILRTRREWEAEADGAVAEWQKAIAAADHLVLIFPLWLGDMPALMKAFLEQVLRPGFAIGTGKRTLSSGLLKGKSARIIVTMGMPALIYRWFFLAHSVRSLRRNILHFVGVKPVRTTLVGSIEGSPASRAKWLERIEALGRASV